MPIYAFVCDTCAAGEEVYVPALDGPPADGARCVLSTECPGAMRRTWNPPMVGRGTSGHTPPR